MPNNVSITVTTKGKLPLLAQLETLSLPRREKARVTREMGRQVQRAARKNVRQQRTIDGQTMPPRAGNRNRRKVLRKITRKLGVQMMSATTAKVTWKNSVTAQIADRHQRGVPEKWTANKAKKIYGQPDYSAPASRAQAKSLIAEGYKRPVKKKRGSGVAYKRVSQKWIRENMTQGQAGVVLRSMRDAKRKRAWTVTVPERPFLGVSTKDSERMLNGLARQAVSKIKNARR